MLLQLLRADGIEPDVRYLFGDFATQLAMVRAGLAIALVPGMAVSGGEPDRVPASADGVRLLSCRPALGRSLVLASRETDADLPALQALAGTLRAVAAQAVRAAPVPGS